MIEIKTVGKTIIEVDEIGRGVKSLTVIGKFGSGTSAALNPAQAEALAKALLPAKAPGLLWRRPDGAEIMIEDENEGTGEEMNWAGTCTGCGNEITVRDSADIHELMTQVERHAC